MNIEKLILDKTIADMKRALPKQAVIDLLRCIRELETRTGIPCKGCPLKGSNVPKYSSCLDRLILYYLYYLYNHDSNTTADMLRTAFTEMAHSEGLRKEHGRC